MFVCLLRFTKTAKPVILLYIQRYDMSDIDTAFNAAIASGTIHGAVLCASNAAGDATYTRVFGSRTLLSGETVPRRPDDVLSLASATKLLTTIAALQCVEDGLLTLDGDVGALLPELAAKRVLTGYDEDGEAVYEAARGPITLAMLLTHSAGTSYPPSDANLSRWHGENHGFRPGNEGRLRVEEAYAHPLGYQPGTGWMYGFGVDWAGRAVERATGVDLVTFLRSRVLGPLGMKGEELEFWPVKEEGAKKRQVDRNPGDVDATGIAVMGAEAAAGQRYLRGAFGGHAGSMTAEGYLAVLRALVRNDGELLKKSTVGGMMRDRLGEEAGEVFRGVAAGEGGVLMRGGMDGERRVGFGFGGVVALDEPGEDEGTWRCGKGTMAWGGGYTLAWFVDWEKGICGVGAVDGVVPTDLEAVNGLKGVFRRGVYKELGVM